MDGRTGENVTIGSGEVVNGDLYAFGNNISIDGIVNGDIFAAGKTITINGIVNGGITVVGQIITVNGAVAHGARLAGQTINFSGSVDRDLVIAGSDANISGKAKVGDDLLLAAGTARVDGHVGGDIKGGAGEVSITDGVGGNVKINVNRLNIAPIANIKGDLTYISENEATIQSGAQIGGKVIHKLPEAEKPAQPAILKDLTGKALGFLMIFLIGLIIVLAAPKKLTSLTDVIRAYPWQSLGWGAVILFAIPLAAIFVCFTVIGIPLALITLLLYGIVIYLSQIPVALLIGLLIIKRSTQVESKGILIGALAVGLAILVVLRWLPFIGFLFGLVAVLFGLGTLVVRGKVCKIQE
jgi:cytoskeletal protein CcmA (bactofilin family)